jgi:FHS family Na+ dependent glucose MFS transporter 1
MESHSPGIKPHALGMEPCTTTMETHVPGMETHTPTMEPHTPGMESHSPGIKPHTAGMEPRAPGYPWPLLARTILLLHAYLALGVCDAIRGPTLLDLRDLLGASIADISIIFIFGSVGSLLGCLLTGVLLDRLSEWRSLYIGLTVAVMGVTNAALPYSPNLPALYALCFLSGLGSGALDTAGSVTVLQIWQGRDSGPYMHALHFTFGVGAFLAPVISRPFLMAEGGGRNGTERAVAAVAGTVWSVRTLYPLVGAFAVLISLGFIAYQCKDRRTARVEVKEETKEAENALNKFYSIFIVCLLSVLFFLYVGMEVAFGTFVSVFAVQSNLGFTRQQVSELDLFNDKALSHQGSDVTAVFWGTFAVTRGLAIFAAILAPPNLIM